MERNCDHCGRPYEARSPRSKFCKDPECVRARERARNRRRSSGVTGDADVIELPARKPAADRECGQLEESARAELVACGRLESFAGQVVLGLARRLDVAKSDTGSSYAGLAKELRAAMIEATKNVPRAADEVDELRARRLARHA